MWNTIQTHRFELFSKGALLALVTTLKPYPLTTLLTVIQLSVNLTLFISPITSP